jgi:hypothetical protein
MAEAPQNGKELLHFAHATGMNEYQPPQLHIKKAMK